MSINSQTRNNIHGRKYYLAKKPGKLSLFDDWETLKTLYYMEEKGCWGGW
jgi:hypothetical protein